MRSTEPTVFLVWDFGMFDIVEENPTLRAVDLTYDLAKEHREHLQQKGIKITIESCSANHLFGALGNKERIERRRPL